MSNYSLHRNGGGRIIGVDSSVGHDCYICPDSHVEDASSISYDSTLYSSAVSKSTLALASIESSVIVNSHIAGAYIGDSVLTGVVVHGTPAKRADLQNVLLGQDVVVHACKLRDFKLAGPYLIHSDWIHEPRHRLLEQPNGVQLGLIECGDDRFHAGCECRAWTEWDEKEGLLRKYFLRQGWDLDTFNSIRTTFNSWR